MKIAYFLAGGIERTTGVLEKVAAQIFRWRQEGHEARLFAPASNGKGAAVLDNVPHEYIAYEYGQRNRAIGELVEKIAAWKPDIVYCRWAVWRRRYREIARQAKLVAELNADDRVEYRQTKPWKTYLYHMVTRKQWARHCAGVISVTNELANTIGRGRAAVKVISNGVQTAGENDDRKEKKANGAPPSLVFMGSKGYNWHGIDKVVQLARLFPDWRFNIVGEKPTQMEADAAPNIQWHGWLERPKYLEVLSSSDIGIGTLALHRRGMNEACTLKVREYLGNGLPVIVGYVDVDFSNNFEYCLTVPNREDNVTACQRQIADFVEKNKHIKVPKSAVDFASWTAKEQERIGFFEDLTKKNVIK